MANKEDTLFYAGYGFVIIMLGLMLLLVSIEFIDGWTAFGLWLLSLSMILIGLGNIRTDSAPRGSGTLIGLGFLFTIISIMVLGMILGLFSIYTASALLILLVGLGILGLGIRRTRSTS